MPFPHEPCVYFELWFVSFVWLFGSISKPACLGAQDEVALLPAFSWLVLMLVGAAWWSRLRWRQLVQSHKNRRRDTPTNANEQPLSSDADGCPEISRELRAASLPTRLGRYQLGQLLGKGSSSDVYTCQSDEGLIRAAKILRPAEANDPRPNEAMLRRFENEIEVLSKLQGEPLVRLLDEGWQDEHRYAIFERLDGLTLYQIVRQFGGQSESRGLLLLDRLCAAIQAIHDAGLAHGDIQPTNIFICRETTPDSVRLIDFELTEPWDRTQTRQRILGTPAYLSPEACQPPFEFDPRSDIYAWGCVAYFLFSGRAPVLGNNPIETCYQQIHRAPVDLTEAAPLAISTPVSELVMECLQKDPKNRPNSLATIRTRINVLREHTVWSVEDARRWWQENG